MTQLTVAEQIQVGSFRKTRKIISNAKTVLNQRLIEFYQEINQAPVKPNRFYVPQRHS